MSDPSPDRVELVAHEIGEGTDAGHVVRILRSPAGLEARFAPGVGMVGCSLRHEGEELLGQGGGLAKYAEVGSTFGIPLLHPWANRLDGLSYEVGGVAVRLDPEHMPVRLDGNGLPIHGLAAASPYWAVTGAAADDDAAILSARLPFADHPHAEFLKKITEDALGRLLLPSLEREIRRELTEEAEEHAVRVFARNLRSLLLQPPLRGRHPHLQLPGAPRAAWNVALPVRAQATLDDRGIPTGEVRDVEVGTGPLGDRVYDDLFCRLADEPRFALEGAGRRLEVRFERGYPVAQVYAPEGQDFICFEPMTAPTNALVRGGPALPLVRPGAEHATCFSITVRPT